MRDCERIRRTMTSFGFSFAAQHDQNARRSRGAAAAGPFVARRQTRVRRAVPVHAAATWEGGAEPKKYPNPDIMSRDPPSHLGQPNSAITPVTGARGGGPAWNGQGGICLQRHPKKVQLS